MNNQDFIVKNKSKEVITMSTYRLIQLASAAIVPTIILFSAMFLAISALKSKGIYLPIKKRFLVVLFYAIAFLCLLVGINIIQYSVYIILVSILLWASSRMF